MWNRDGGNMTGVNLLINVLLLFIAIIISQIFGCSSALSDKRLCYDPNCSEPVSLARTSIKYVPNEPGLLPFEVNVIAKVYSKEAGNRTDLWGVEINGKHGYVPKLFLKEYKILHKKLLYEVSTDSSPSKNPHSEDKKEAPKEIDASRVLNDNLDLRSTEELPEIKVDATPAYEVIDGTTVHLDPKEPPVQPTLVEEVIQTTVVPNEQNTISDSGLNGSVFKEHIEVSEEEKAEEKTVSTEKAPLKVDVADFVTTREVLDVPKMSGVDSLSNISAIIDDKTEEKKEISDFPQILTKGLELKGGLEDEIQGDEKGDGSDEEEKAIETLGEIKKDDEDVGNSNMKSDEGISENISQREVDVTSTVSNETKDTEVGLRSDEKSEMPDSSNQVKEDDTLIEIDVTSNVSNEIKYTVDMKSEMSDSPNQVKEYTQIETDVASTVTNEDTRDTKEDTKDSDKIEPAVVTNVKTDELIIPVESIENDTEGTDMGDTSEENVTINKESLESITKSEKIDSEEIEESKEEDLKKYGDTISPLFLESNVTNESITSSEDVKAPDIIEPDLEVLDIQNASESVSDIKDVKEEVSSVAYESSIENTLSIKEEDSSDVCTAEDVKCSVEEMQTDFTYQERTEENAIMAGIQIENSYWMMLMYLSITAVATLMFSLGYYCIENMRRDRQLIARINKLEKDLLISEAECSMANENLKSTKEKLSRMEDESFGSDEMVLSLRAELEALQNVKVELEEQVAMLEKDLESATEAGLELERMLREVLSTNDDVNPLAQSVEDLQTRLNAQQAANESLTNALNLKTQENDSLSAEVASAKKKCEELQTEVTSLTENLKLEMSRKDSIERTMTEKVQRLEMQIKEISTERAVLQKELKTKQAEATDLAEVINRLNSNNLDLNKLYDVSHVKAEATALLEERNELKVRLAEIEGAHNLLEEHVKMVKEEMATLSEQYKLAEKEKKDAETRLEVLTNFFEEKEAQRQKEEAIWLQQQGEVVSTVERIQMMQTEIQNYKQQIEMLKREIMDQEREYKSQISHLETKAHEQWVVARQVERRLEESKVEAGQLRNRLTLIEKNINDIDPEAKLHRLEANGETTTSPPLFIGAADSSNSSMMFTSSSNVPPPPPPSYLHSLFPPYLPPPLPNSSGLPAYDVSQRPPPLGGRLSSPPPMHPLHPPPVSNRYDNPGSPPPMSPPHLLPRFNHRSPPPSFGSEIIPPPPPPGSILPPPPLGAPHSWSEDPLPPSRNPGFHPATQRARNHKGSLHSSRESLEKLHHNSKV